MSEPFICYDFLDVGRRIDKFRSDVVGNGKAIVAKLESLIKRARNENVDPLIIDNMISAMFSVLNVIDYVDERLSMLVKSIERFMDSASCGISKKNVCTHERMQELVNRYGGARGVIECFKQNIVACKDITSSIVTAREGEKVLDVVYFEPSGELERELVGYLPGGERIKHATPPIVAATYEKCLGIRVEVEGDNRVNRYGA
jgi:hypothetical protein